MLKSILNLEGVAVLTKEQQINLTGGNYAISDIGLSGNDSHGTCCARQFRDPNNNGNLTASVHCGIRKEDAIRWSRGGVGGGNWCCDSCGSASWTVIG